MTALPQYTFYFGSLATGTISGALPLKSVSFSMAINEPGSFTAEINLADPNIRKMAPIDLTTPAKAALWIDRGGTLIWGGIVWGRTYDAATYRLKLSGSTFDSYGAKRLVDYSTTFSEDEIQIAVDLWTNMQNTAHGNINCPAIFTASGKTVSQQWQTSDYKFVTDALKDLTNQGTFDYTVSVFWNGNGAPAQQLVFGYPNLGRTTSASGLQFSTPGNILSYTYQEDGGIVANRTFAIGNGSGADQLAAASLNTGSLSVGYPVLDQVTSYKDVTDQTALQALSDADLALYSQPVAQVQIVVRGDSSPTLGNYNIGDYCTLNITDPRFPNGYTDTFQIRTISVALDDSGVEKVTLSLYAVTSRRKYASSFADVILKLKNDVHKMNVKARQFTCHPRNVAVPDYTSIVSGSLTPAFQFDFPYKSPRMTVHVEAYQATGVSCVIDLYDLVANVVLSPQQTVTATTGTIYTFKTNQLTSDPNTGRASVAIRASRISGTFNLRPVWAGNMD